MAEMLVTLIILGVLTAFGFPSILSLLNFQKIKQTEDQTRNILKEAQRAAIRRSQSCTLKFNRDHEGNVTSIEEINDKKWCLGGSSTAEFPKNVQVKTNSLSEPTISFSFKGNTSIAPSNEALVFNFSSAGVNGQRCLVISQGLGIIRNGNYNPVTEKCTSSSSYL